MRKEKYEIVSRTNERAEIAIYKGKKKDVFILTWQEAEKEPFTKDKGGNVKTNYATPRSRMQMLWARVVSDGVRATFPQVVAGTYTPEEVEDFTDEEKAERPPLSIPGAEEPPKEIEPPAQVQAAAEQTGTRATGGSTGRA